jgi:ribosomal protein S12 methylthiotransferase accessory factor YcaO
LQESGLIVGDEIRHRSSLSPHGFYRKWRLAVSVRNGRHGYRLTGVQTSYGRGLCAGDARASYAMEMVERCASFASFDSMTTTGLAVEHSLVYGRYEELRRGGASALDPNRLHLEVPYHNEPLHWLKGSQIAGTNLRPVWVPVQSIFLFCNLDEISLFSGLGSTGLASGNSLEQAKVSALLEVIERDGQAVSVFDAARCFKLAADDAVLAPLLKDYNQRGVHVQFQDMSEEFGIPCYQCFVVGPKGQIVTGAGAHLDGQRAVISALTEVPYPYPHGPRSLPAAEDLPTRRFEELPDYSTGSSAADLALLEAVLNAHGLHPIYVEITRQDIGIPVVKALVPGLELMADFDRFSRVSPRMLRNLVRQSG